MDVTSSPVPCSFAEFNKELVRLDKDAQCHARKRWIDRLGIAAFVLMCLLTLTALIFYGFHKKIPASSVNWMLGGLVGSELLVEVCTAVYLYRDAVRLRNEGRFGFLDKQSAVENQLAEVMAQKSRDSLKDMERRLGVEMEMLEYRGEILAPAAAIIGILLGLVFKNTGDVKSHPYPALLLNALLATDLIVLVFIAERRQHVRRMMWIARKSAKLAKPRRALDKSEGI